MTNINNFPLVSVVMASYNGERFIGKQLDSIIAQTYPNLEIIVVDDGSTDNTMNILQEYALQHANLLVYRNKVNLGYVKNFEKAMLLAKGDFIAPSDQDDIWLPKKIDTLMKNMGEYDIVYCDSSLINDKDEQIGKNLSAIKQLINFNDCIMYAIGNSAPGHGMIIRRETVLQSLPLPVMIPHDHSIAFVATFKKGLLFVNEPLVMYRQHNANVFGATKIASENDKQPVQKKKQPSLNEKYKSIRERVQWMYNICPDELTVQKAFYLKLNQVYASFSLANNISRVGLFFRYRHKILSFKKRTELRRWLFCIKLFWTIQ